MKGAELKEKLKSSRYSMAEIAKLIGVSPQNLNNMLSKDDVRTSLLESISKACNIPISVLYGDTYSINGSNNTTAINNSTATAADDRLIQLLLNKDEQLTMAMKQTSKAQAQIDKLLGIES